MKLRGEKLAVKSVGLLSEDRSFFVHDPKCQSVTSFGAQQWNRVLSLFSLAPYPELRTSTSM